MAKGLPGYPSGKAIRKQAAALANAAVPTKRSITGPYNQGIEDTTSFTAALMHLLGQSNPGAGYDAAISQQQGVGQAAAARLAALGGQYGAGSAAAVGGLGDSALSSLISRGAAAKSYGASLPAVGAARGQLFQQGLIHDRQTALQNRGDQLRSAFTQALDQVQNQALARSTALASIQQNNRAFREGKREFNKNLSFQQDQADQSQANWEKDYQLQKTQLLASLQGSAGSKAGVAGLAKSLGLTPNEVHGILGDAATILNGTPPEMAKIPVYNSDGKIIGYNTKPVGGSGKPGAVQAEVPFNTAVQQLIQQNIQRPIALIAASRAYKIAPRNSVAFVSFAKWMRDHGINKWWKIVQKNQNSPVRAYVNP